ncbi:uncharacterized protein LY89DRAFT_487860 [Mollisia scopiformis]|uniref:Zn(2)-C6 fungal-type domain-containing protein n=1 Tax=Mollisia scopiformis TaxID=149040 RepID=A0A194XGK7_MOLSC|nr:uncharacterized protein LY89DRAFT_487860 [Mollisia scopiformis]KUJ19269.1 hypothetical protein LY89DRAFT_487860 [Mollisia scopiformis]
MTGVEKRKRASRPKSKGGCRTCKLRHVKCDESRPACKRCTRWGHQCDGYDDEIVAKKTTRVVYQLMPKSNAHPVVITCPSLGGIGFSHELEARYFRLYQEELSDELSAGFETILWNRVVLQACTNDSIRQLIIAIAALKKAGREPSANLASQHRKYALYEYGKALKGVQAALTLRRDGLRIVLIAALLIFVLESMFGDTKRAVTNIQTALDLINQRLLLMSHACRGPFITRGFLPPSFPDLIEEEILNSFLRLDRPAVGLLSRSKGSRPQNKMFSSKLYLEDFQIPETFSSIGEARLYYERLRFRVFPEHAFETKLKDTTSLPEGASAPAILLMELFSEITDESSAPAIRDDLARWHQAFGPLLRHSRTKEGSSTYVAAMMLQIQAAAISIPLFILNSIRESTDPAVTAARDVVQLSKALVADPRFPKTFVFEMGIIPCLWIVVILYPDFHLKREAIAVLRAMEPRVECVWDSKIVADTGDVVVEMLEKQQRQTH